MWTQERIELLTRLWIQGDSARAIAEALGEPRVTRSAVIGKVHRLRISARNAGGEGPAARNEGGIEAGRLQRIRRRRLKPAHPWQPKAPGQGRASGTTKAKALLLEPLPPPAETDIPRIQSVEALEEHHCRWITGDVQEPGWGYCGERRVNGLPYCSHHVRRATGEPWAPKRPRGAPNYRVLSQPAAG